MNLPPINQRGGYSLPPINQIPGYSVPGQPPANPIQQLHGFWSDPATGDGISVKNAADAVYSAPQGNPLYYGQTAAYTGPQGETDAAEPQPDELPPVQEVAGQQITYEDMLRAAMAGLLGADPMEMSGGPQAQAMYAQQLLNGTMANDKWIQSQLGGLDLSAPYESGNEDYARILARFGREGMARSGGGDGGR